MQLCHMSSGTNALIQIAYLIINAFHLYLHRLRRLVFFSFCLSIKKKSFSEPIATFLISFRFMLGLSLLLLLILRRLSVAVIPLTPLEWWNGERIIHLICDSTFHFLQLFRFKWERGWSHWYKLIHSHLDIFNFQYDKS